MEKCKGGCTARIGFASTFIPNLYKWFTDIKLFADDTSLFSVVDDTDESASKLNNDLIRMQEWAYQWEMSFNPTELNQLMKLYSLKKLKIVFILIFNLIACQLLKQHLKSTWDLT